MKGNWRRYLVGSLACLLMAGLFSLGVMADVSPVILPEQAPEPATVQNGGQPGVELNGSQIDLTAEVADGSIYLPLRAISEALGFGVGWSEGNQQITLSAPGKDIGLSLKESKMQVNSHEMYMMDNFKMINDRTYLVKDFFAEHLGLIISWDKVGGKVSLNSVTQNPVVIENQREFSETQTLKLTVQYPQLNGLHDSEVQQKLNSLFAGLATDAKKEGLKNEQSLKDEDITRNIKTETYFNYMVKYNQNGILSLIFSDYQYSGGAHGMTVQSSYTFDLETGKVYKLKDLFQNGDDYVSVISQEVKKQMQDRDMTVLLNPFDSIKADQDFYLTNNALVVYFQQYEYLPYAFGIPEFEIDFSSLQDSLNSAFNFLGVTQFSQAMPVVFQNLTGELAEVKIPVYIPTYLPFDGPFRLINFTTSTANYGFEVIRSDKFYPPVQEYDGPLSMADLVVDLTAGDAPFARYPVEDQTQAQSSGTVELDGITANSYAEGMEVTWSQDNWDFSAVGHCRQDGIRVAREILKALPTNGSLVPGAVQGKLRAAQMGNPMYVTASWTYDGKTWYTLDGRSTPEETIKMAGSMTLIQNPGAPAVNVAVFKDQGILAFVSKGLLYTINGQTGEVKAITESGQALYPTWSSDGQWLAFVQVADSQAQDGRLWITRPDGSQAHQVQGLPEQIGRQNFSWSPRENLLAVGGRDGVWLVPPEGEPHQLLSGVEGPLTGMTRLSWSPNGKLLAYNVTLPYDPKDRPGCNDAFYTIAVEGGQPVKQIEVPQAGIIPAGWWPDGKGLLYWVDPLHSASIAADGLGLVSLHLGDSKPQALTSSLIHPDWLSFSPQGKLLLVKGGGRIVWADKSLVVIDVAAGSVQDLHNPEGNVSLDPSFSPDGNHIAFVAAKDLGKNVWGFEDSKELAEWVATRTLWIEDVDGGNAHPLASAGGGVYQPLWSKDGSRLLFVRDNALWMVRSEGGVPAKIVDLLPASEDLFGFYGYLSFSDKMAWFRD